MILLITFIAHSLLNYLNLRLKNRKLKVDILMNEDESEMFLFNESSFDNLAANFDYSNVVTNKSTFNSTFDLKMTTTDINDNETEYFEINSINPIEKHFDFENSDIETSCSESFCLSESNLTIATKRSFSSSVTSSSFKSNRTVKCASFRNKTVLKSKINKYLKSQSLVLDQTDYLSFLNDFNSKQKKFKSKYERFNNASKFYRRQRKRTSTIRQHLSFASSGNIVPVLRATSYKPSIKVEKLLNDTRGMRKYLIDYNCLMSTNKTTCLNDSNKHINDSLLFEKFRSSFLNENSVLNETEFYQSTSNRCSSGYLSDC